MQEFDFGILHVPGKLMPADLPSRKPLPTTADLIGARMHADGELPPPLPTVRDAAGNVLPTPSPAQLATDLGVATNRAAAAPAGAASTPSVAAACLAAFPSAVPSANYSAYHAALYSTPEPFAISSFAPLIDCLCPHALHLSLIHISQGIVR